MKINVLAKRLNVTPRAIRFYEKKGLLNPDRCPDNGYRVYDEQDAWRLQTIASLREIGLSLNQIQGILEKMDRGNTAGIHHYLEIQRMGLVSKWVEWKHAIQTLDELIARFEAKKGLVLEDLFLLADDLKQIQESQTSWRDKWDFDRMAEEYDQFASFIAAGPFVSPLEYEAVLEFMVQWIAPQSRDSGLDIGTGTGNLAGKLLAAGASMHVVDQSKEMLIRCRDKFPQIVAKLGNALALPFVENQFSFVVSAFALHHLDEMQQLLALEEMNRVLGPGGRICLSGLMVEDDHAVNSVNDGELHRSVRSDKYPMNRSKLLEWFRQHDFITVQHQLNDWIHVVYAARKH